MEWDDLIAGSDQQAQFLYGLQQLSQEKGLCLLGGASASIKIPQLDVFGEPQSVMWMTPPGWRGAQLSQADLIPIDGQRLAQLTKLESLNQDLLENELTSSRLKAASPYPSTEAWLHAVLPFACIYAVRMDALLALQFTSEGSKLLESLFGTGLVTLEKGASDYACAKACLSLINSFTRPAMHGILLSDGCLLVGGDSPRAAFSHLVECQSMAEAYLQGHSAWNIPSSPSTLPVTDTLAKEMPLLRKKISEAFGRPLILSHLDLGASAQALRIFEASFGGKEAFQGESLLGLSSRPMVGRDVDAYLVLHGWAKGQAAPRLIVDRELGFFVAGRTGAETEAGLALYRQAILAMLCAEMLNGKPVALLGQSLVQALPQSLFSSFNTESSDRPQLFDGEVALVTGGASGIGKACVESLLVRGAAVVTLDVNPRVENQFSTPAYLGLVCDLTDEAAILKCFEKLVRRFGGMDMLVVNAGIFPSGIRIEDLDTASWNKVMRINLDSNLVIMRESYPLLKEAPRYGRVLVNASKNVLAPGAGAAAYSASKSAVTQLARVAALEWGKDKIRVNIIHPDAIFDTGIWTEEVLKARAAHYGMTVQQYKTRNVLGVELNSHYVGELVAEMLGPLFEKITGAQVPVDGGSDRVI